MKIYNEISMTYNDETDEWVTISEDSYDHEGGIDEAQNYGGFIAQAAEAERNRQTQSRQFKDQLLFNQQSVDLAKDKWQTQKDITMYDFEREKAKNKLRAKQFETTTGNIESQQQFDKNREAWEKDMWDRPSFGEMLTDKNITFKDYAKDLYWKGLDFSKYFDRNRYEEDLHPEGPEYKQLGMQDIKSATSRGVGGSAELEELARIRALDPNQTHLSAKNLIQTFNVPPVMQDRDSYMDRMRKYFGGNK